MDKLKELEKRMDRVRVLMIAARMSIEELLASAAEKEVNNCEKCPLKKTCDNHDEDGCYITWLKFLEEGRIE
jgi:hypothetical protein